MAPLGSVNKPTSAQQWAQNDTEGFTIPNRRGACRSTGLPMQHRGKSTAHKKMLQSNDGGCRNMMIKPDPHASMVSSLGTISLNDLSSDSFGTSFDEKRDRLCSPNDHANDKDKPTLVDRQGAARSTGLQHKGDSTAHKKMLQPNDVGCRHMIITPDPHASMVSSLGNTSFNDFSSDSFGITDLKPTQLSTTQHRTKTELPEACVSNTRTPIMTPQSFDEKWTKLSESACLPTHQRQGFGLRRNADKTEKRPGTNSKQKMRVPFGARLSWSESATPSPIQRARSSPVSRSSCPDPNMVKDEKGPGFNSPHKTRAPFGAPSSRSGAAPPPSSPIRRAQSSPVSRSPCPDRNMNKNEKGTGFNSPQKTRINFGARRSWSEAATPSSPSRRAQSSPVKRSSSSDREMIKKDKWFKVHPQEDHPVLADSPGQAARSDTLTGPTTGSPRKNQGRGRRNSMGSPVATQRCNGTPRRSTSSMAPHGKEQYSTIRRSNSVGSPVASHRGCGTHRLEQLAGSGVATQEGAQSSPVKRSSSSDRKMTKKDKWLGFNSPNKMRAAFRARQSWSEEATTPTSYVRRMQSSPRHKVFKVHPQENYPVLADSSGQAARRDTLTGRTTGMRGRRNSMGSPVATQSSIAPRGKEQYSTMRRSNSVGSPVASHRGYGTHRLEQLAGSGVATQEGNHGKGGAQQAGSSPGPSSGQEPAIIRLSLGMEPAVLLSPLRKAKSLESSVISHMCNRARPRTQSLGNPVSIQQEAVKGKSIGTEMKPTWTTIGEPEPSITSRTSKTTFTQPTAILVPPDDKRLSALENERSHSLLLPVEVKTSDDNQETEPEQTNRFDLSALTLSSAGESFIGLLDVDDELAAYGYHEDGLMDLKC